MKNFSISKIAFFALMLFFLASCGKTTSEDMNILPSDKEATTETLQFKRKKVRGPNIEIDVINGAGICNGIQMNAFGANYTVDPVTFNTYYVGQGGLNLEVKTLGNLTVLSKYDAYCLNNQASRTTINDFVCNAVGLPASLQANTTYKLRLYNSGADSGWHFFTTPNSFPCGN